MKIFPLPRKGKLFFAKSFTPPINKVYEKSIYAVLIMGLHGQMIGKRTEFFGTHREQCFQSLSQICSYGNPCPIFEDTLWPAQIFGKFSSH